MNQFKDTATEMLAQPHGLAGLLIENGYPIEILRSARVGYIVYSDLHQVVAEPFNNTPT